MARNFRAELWASALVLSIAVVAAPGTDAAALYTDVQVNDVGGLNLIGQANTSRNVVVTSDGNIYVAFWGDNGVRVAKSTNRGQSFQPSVQVAADRWGEVEIEADGNGVLYVVWAYAQGSGTMMFSRSTDGGQTFTAPVAVGMGSGAAHLAANAPHVYVLSQDSSVLYHNHNNGVGAFDSTNIVQGYNYSDVRVDPNSGQVIVLASNPQLACFRSNDNGATFTQLALDPGGSVDGLSCALSTGVLGRFLYAAGGNGTQAFRVDLDTGSSVSLTFGNCTDTQGRSLAADAFGDVVDGYNAGGALTFAVSHDQGKTFGPATLVSNATGASLNVARNPLYGDVDVVYQNLWLVPISPTQTGGGGVKQMGNIYLSVYTGLMPGAPSTISATNGTPQSAALGAVFGAALQATVQDVSSTPVPNVAVTFTAPASGASGSFAQRSTVLTDASGIATAPAFTANTVAGTYLVTATVNPALSPPATFNLTNMPGPADHLAVQTQPSSTARVGQPFARQPAVGVLDQYGNLCSNDSSTVVTVALANGAGGLQGTLTATASDGLSAFWGLSCSFMGTVTLKFTSGSLLPATSGKIVVGSLAAVASASPRSGLAPLQVSFAGSATSSFGGELSYAWDFGDGSATATGQNVTHTFSSDGAYNVVLTVTDSGGANATANVSVTVGGLFPADSNGNGFPDEIEKALGPGVGGASGTPFGLPSPVPGGSPDIRRLQIRLNFAQPAAHDSLTIQGQVRLRNDFKPQNQYVILDVGGVVRAFVLDVHGRAKNGNDQFRLSGWTRRTQPAMPNADFYMSLRKGTFAAALQKKGFVNQYVQSTGLSVPVIIILDGHDNRAIVGQNYQAKEGLWGRSE